MIRNEPHPESDMTFEVGNGLKDGFSFVHDERLLNDSFLVNCLIGIFIAEKYWAGIVDWQGCWGLLRGDDAAHGVTARKHDAAMIQHCVQRSFGDARTGYDGPSTGRAPICFGVHGEHSMALSADAFHGASVPEAART